MNHPNENFLRTPLLNGPRKSFSNRASHLQTPALMVSEGGRVVCSMLDDAYSIQRNTLPFSSVNQRTDALTYFMCVFRH